MGMILKSLLRPYLRYELPGFNRLGRNLGILGEDTDPLWKGAPQKICHGKYHGYLMRCDLSNWSQRATWFLGRYYEYGTQSLLMRYLQPGDRAVDIGANVGMISLLMSWLVGPEGAVESFEPNPECCEKIEWLLQTNHLRNVTLHRMGLADEAGTLTLSLRGSHTGTGTLAPVPENEKGPEARSYDVPIRVGDGVLTGADRPIAAIKIDVEGFECRVLDGLRETMRRWHPMIITEVDARHLAHAGASIPDLVGRMTGAGYSGFKIRYKRIGLMGKRMWLEPLAPTPGPSQDVAWLHPANPRTAALRADLAE